MAVGRIVVVHGTGSVRAHLGELLTREGYDVESLDSTYRAMARVVDEPADLVVLGLAELADVELQLIPSLRAERKPPRILVTFPASMRERASRALTIGADAYLLEPFYAGEMLRVVASLLEAPAPSAERPKADPEPLRRLAREVAHAVNNPLQVVRLLLEKKSVTKKEIEEGLPPQLERVEEVAGRLRAFGAMRAGPPETVEAEKVARQAAASAGVKLTAGGHTTVRVDESTYRAGLEALFAALKERSEDVAATMEEGVVRVAMPAAAFAGEEPRQLLDSVFVVTEDRELRSGLALPRWLLEEQGGSLELTQAKGEIEIRASAPG